MKSFIFVFVSAALILCLPTLIVNAQSDKFSTAWEKFREQYLAELKAAGIVGSSFVFLKDNKVVAHEYYGSANLEKNQPVDEKTNYHWA
jgi:CubicO group peptidase (beta-lactamase class C family)